MLARLFPLISDSGLRLEERDGGWALAGRVGHVAFGLVDKYLVRLADRN